jgi:hypothetical protein
MFPEQAKIADAVLRGCLRPTVCRYKTSRSQEEWRGGQIPSIFLNSIASRYGQIHPSKLYEPTQYHVVAKRASPSRIMRRREAGPARSVSRATRNEFWPAAWQFLARTALPSSDPAGDPDTAFWEISPLKPHCRGSAGGSCDAPYKSLTAQTLGHSRSRDGTLTTVQPTVWRQNDHKFEAQADAIYSWDGRDLL